MTTSSICGNAWEKDACCIDILVDCGSGIARKTLIRKILKRIMSFSLEKIKEFEREIERRQGAEKAKEIEKKKVEEEKKKKRERAKLHQEWRKKGVVYYRSMLKKEKAEEEMRILHEKRLAEEKAKEEAAKEARKQAQREEWRRIREEAAREKADRKRKTKWYDNGCFYYGEFFEDKGPDGHRERHDVSHTPHGFGEFRRPENKLEYRGSWFQGQMHGFGEYHFKNGKIYRGEFRYGQFHGFGKITEAPPKVGEDDEENRSKNKTSSKSNMERGCIFYKDKRVAWWDELQEGRRIQIFLPNVGFRSEESHGSWHEATIIQYDRNRKPENTTKRGKEHLVKFEYDIKPPGTKFRECEWMNLSRVRFKVRGGGLDSKFSIGPEIPLRHTVVNLRTETKLCIPSSKESDTLGNNLEFKSLLRKGFESELRHAKENLGNTPTKSSHYTGEPDYSSKYDEGSEPGNSLDLVQRKSSKGLRSFDGQNSSIVIRDKRDQKIKGANADMQNAISIYNDPKSRRKRRNKGSTIHQQHMAIFEDASYHTNKSDVLERTLKLRERVGKQLALR